MKLNVENREEWDKGRACKWKNRQVAVTVLQAKEERLKGSDGGQIWSKLLGDGLTDQRGRMVWEAFALYLPISDLPEGHTVVMSWRRRRGHLARPGHS